MSEKCSKMISKYAKLSWKNTTVLNELHLMIEIISHLER